MTDSRLAGKEMEQLELMMGSGHAATQTVQVSTTEAKRRLKEDGNFFIEFFIPEQLEFPVPQLHKDIWVRLTDQKKDRVLLAIPRDHAKTTLAKLSVVWHFLFTGHTFGLYLTNTSASAINACRDIMDYMQTPNFVSTFGPISIIKSSETDGLWIFEIDLGNNNIKTCILRATGANQKMRGINIRNTRPDFAVVDDVEDLENTATPAMQKQLDKWLMGTFMKALSRNRKVLWLGNILRKTSLLYRFSKWEVWNPVVFGAITIDRTTGELVPLWSDRWSLADLKIDFMEYQELQLVETWMCEMMNMPGRGANGFQAENFNYAILPAPDDLQAAFITIDPAFGLTKSEHDRTAIVVHGIRKTGCPMVLDYRVGHFSEEVMFREALALATYWKAGVWGIESVAAQRVLLTLFELYAVNYKVMGKYDFVPLMAGMEKHGRISGFVGAMKGKVYAIPLGDLALTTSLLNYDLTKKEQDDDLPDSAAYGPQMIANYLPMVYAAHARLTVNHIDTTRARVGMECANA